jgi:hypothetical protein
MQILSRKNTKYAIVILSRLLPQVIGKQYFKNILDDIWKYKLLRLF